MRAELLDELTRVLTALEIHDPSAFTFAGRNYQIDQSANPALDSNALISLLQSCLYENAYSRRFTGVLASPAAAQPGRDMSSVLAMANTSRERWVSDWRVTQVLPSGQIAAQRYDVNRLFWPGEFISAEGAGGALRQGAAITVFCRRDAAALQPGFYFAYGEAISDQMEENPLVRFYLNLRAAGAQLAVQLFSAALNRFRVPFRFKCLNNSGLYPRADAAVLYVARRYCRVCGEVLGELHPRLSSELEPDVPLFSLRLARGLSFAEDPGTGESFGMSRCRLVAEGVFDSFRQGTQLPGSRLAAVEAKFKGAGLTLDRPYLSPGSTGNYSWPKW